MIKLVRRSLTQRAKKGERDFIFVEFNAWLYQGYDDARAALMEVIASTLAEEAQKRKKGIEKAAGVPGAGSIGSALVKLVAGSAVALSLGMPPVGLLGELWGDRKEVPSAVTVTEHDSTRRKRPPEKWRERRLD